jgi:hypothetical protein
MAEPMEGAMSEPTEDATMARPSSQTHRHHLTRLVLSPHAQAVVHGTDAVGRFNTRLALRVTTGVGSMWCAYAFALLALISLPAAIRSGDPIVIVSWIAQTFLQLVLLPIIIVGQNVQVAATDERARADHETLTAMHALTADVHASNAQHTQILELLRHHLLGDQPPPPRPWSPRCDPLAVWRPQSA